MNNSGLFNEERLDIDDVAEIFIETLMKWQKTSNFSLIYMLPFIDSKQESEINKAVFFDEKKDYVYFSEALFKEVIWPLTDAFSVNTVKARLSEAGILLKGERFKFHARMKYFNGEGEYMRKRMLRFDRKALGFQLEYDFVDACLMSQRERRKIEWIKK